MVYEERMEVGLDNISSCSSCDIMSRRQGAFGLSEVQEALWMLLGLGDRTLKRTAHMKVL